MTPDQGSIARNRDLSSRRKQDIRRWGWQEEAVMVSVYMMTIGGIASSMVVIDSAKLPMAKLYATKQGVRC